MKPIKVSQLNGYIKRILQTDPLLGNLSVIGEVSNLKFHGTGHVYFTLKDENSKINCFMPYENAKGLRFELADGMEIQAEGYVSVYDRGGYYSFNIRDISVSGLGNLSIAYEKLKEKLRIEGLFDEKNKKELPFFPQKIAVVTSETGAAVQDIIKIIESRNNIVDILIYPVLVQGNNAAQDIAKAIDHINEHFSDIDLMIVGRGGGSLEELWAFNEEIVARSIFASKIPVISAVGHETDFTIADFVADRRAETPTAAAQMAVPNVRELRAYIEHKKYLNIQALNNVVYIKELKLKSFDLENMYSFFGRKVDNLKNKAEFEKNKMINEISAIIRRNELKLDGLKKELEALSPMDILKRGYGAILNDQNHYLRSAGDTEEKGRIKIVLHDGVIHAVAEKIYMKGK